MGNINLTTYFCQEGHLEKKHLLPKNHSRDFLIKTKMKSFVSKHGYVLKIL